MGKLICNSKVAYGQGGLWSGWPLVIGWPRVRGTTVYYKVRYIVHMKYEPNIVKICVA